MSADRERAGGLLGYQLGAPVTWGVLPSDPVDGPDPAAARQAISALAADLTTDAEAASRCEQHLLLAQPQLVAPSHLAVGVWVPDPLHGLPCGAVHVEHVVGEDGAVATAERLLEVLEPPDGETGVLRYEVERTRVTAGEAVVVSELATAASGVLVESVTYFVFPDLCRDAVRLAFTTADLHLAAQLVEDARAVADNLTVTARPA